MQSRNQKELVKAYWKMVREHESRGEPVPSAGVLEIKEENPMTPKATIKNIALRLTHEEYERLNHARRLNNLDSLSDNQIVRKLLFDQLDEIELQHFT